MLETLAGRLKWERTTDGIRVEIPSHFNGWIFLQGIGLLIFPHFTYEVFWKHTGSTEPRSFVPEWIGLGLLCLWVAFLRTHKTVLKLSPEEMTVQVRGLGIGLNTGKAATSRLSGLRFVPGEYGIGIEDMNRIQLRKDRKARDFGHGITEEEADALIAKFLEIYPFPKSVTTQPSGAPSEESSHA